MSRRKKIDRRWVNSLLILVIGLIWFKMGGATLVMILLTLLIGFGAIYLSGESFSGIFRKRIDVNTLDELIRLTPYQFEKVVGDCFRDRGYVVHQTAKTGDGGKDLVMFKGGVTYYVECKKYAKGNAIGRPLIQKLVGACYPANAKGIFVTTSKFTQGAITEARRSNIDLIDGQAFIKMLRSSI